MQKTVGLLAGLLFLGTATVFGAPQAPRCGVVKDERDPGGSRRR